MKMYAHDIIKGYLVKNKINFTENYKVKLGIRTLTFDFYIPYGNQCIKHFTAQPADIAIKEYEEACENNNFKFKKIIYIIMCYNFNNGYLGSHNDEERSEIR